MKAILVVLTWILTAVSGCVEYNCYSNEDYARKEADKFCSQGNGDKQRCDSLKIDRNICGIEKDSDDKCIADSLGIQTFIHIRVPECKSLNEVACKAKKVCEWSFKDTAEMTFYEFIKPRS